MPITDSILAANSQTLRRGLSVLRLLAQVGHDGMRISEVARRLRLNKATTIRLTQALLDEQFVTRDSKSGFYRLGPEAFAIGLAAESSYSMQRIFAPFLKELAQISGDVVTFSVRQDYEVICLSRDEGVFPIKNHLLKAGDRYPLGVGAGSSAILADMSDEEVDKALAVNAQDLSLRYPRYDVSVIRRIVLETREQGYSVNPGLVMNGYWAIGVVVRDLRGEPVAAISLAAIEDRLRIVRRTQLATRMIEIAERGRSLM